MKIKVAYIFLCSFLLISDLLARDTIQVKHQAVDHASLNVVQISKDSPIHVRLFSVSDADLGKPKHLDTAELLSRTAPHLLAVDVVESLRGAGFDEVVVDESNALAPEGTLVLSGKFTELNPGSQAARAWIGFGAGRSKVCVEGTLSDHAGTELGNFSHCRKGLGWGESGGQMEKSAIRVGDSIAQFLTEWADEKYSQ